MSRKSKIASSVLVCLLLLALSGAIVAAQADRVIRPIYVITRPQSSAPDEYETLSFLTAMMTELGIDARLRVVPWEQQSDLVWFERDRWDIAGWQMTARPERLDPDEFIYNLFHSSTVGDGYNFIGYINPEYDAIAEAQRVTIDPAERRDLILQAQEILAEDAVYDFTVHPMISIVYNANVFAEDSVVDMAGMGIRNFWTYINIEPIGDQKAIILNNNDTVQSINPFYISGSVDSWVYELIYDRLMRMSPEGLPEPWAAESVEWLSDTEVKIVLRDGMKWHDGEPVTAKDVKFSFEAPMTGEVPMYKPFVDIISEIEIEDDLTLVFYLQRPWAAFEAASLAKINLAPEHIWGPIFEDLKTRPENAESIQEDVPIGSGPFKFADWKFAEEVVLDANTDHFAAPKVDKWIVRFVSNMESTLGMIQNGELNFLASYSGDASLLENLVNRNPMLSMVSSVDLGYRFIALNHNRAPFNDSAFRKALVAITDQEFVVEAVWKGYAVPADSVIAPALEYWKNDNLAWPQGGLEQARQFLEEAGYEWDNRGRLLYPAGQVEEHTPSF